MGLPAIAVYPGSQNISSLSAQQGRRDAAYEGIRMSDRSLKEALEQCVEALLILHPEMDSEEPCVIFEAYESANKALALIKRNKAQHLNIDIASIITRTFYRFMREYPTQYDEADWNDVFCECRFSLQANRATKQIIKYLNEIE